MLRNLFGKKFSLRTDQIHPIAVGRGSCIASNMITMSGQRVGYMYREAADSTLDSGWRFFSGQQDQSFTDDPKNMALYDVNTIANYDPEIIPHLDAPAPIAFARGEDGKFAVVDFPESPDQ